jgi:hypothetical protein
VGGRQGSSLERRKCGGETVEGRRKERREAESEGGREGGREGGSTYPLGSRVTFMVLGRPCTPFSARMSRMYSRAPRVRGST